MGMYRWDGTLVAANPYDGYITHVRRKADDDHTPERRAFDHEPIMSRRRDPVPEHVVALLHHATPISDWAHRELDPVVALHVDEFLRTRNPLCLATLTDREHASLCDFAEGMNAKIKALKRRAGG